MRRLRLPAQLHPLAPAPCMSLLSPASLYWLLLAVPIIGFYLLKVRLRRLPVSTVMFWQQVYEEKQPRAFSHQLRHWLSLLLQLLFLLLVVGGLADPQRSWDQQEQRRIVLIIDNSASMRATDVAPTRLDRAKNDAANLIAGLGARDEMAVISAATQPQVVSGLTNHQRSLHKALASIPATDGPTRVADAIELGRRLLGDDPSTANVAFRSAKERSFAERKTTINGSIVVLSDGCFERADELLKTSPVSWLQVGEPAANVGIVRFQVRRSLLDPLGYQALIEVRNFSSEPVDCRLDLELDGELVDVFPLKLSANGRWSQTIEKTSAAGGLLLARLNHTDVLAADNSARAVLPERRRRPVILVTSGNVFLQRVFEANPLVDLTVTKELPVNRPTDAVVVLHKPRANHEIPSGPVIVLQPEASSDLWDIGDRLDHPLVAVQDKDSPLLAHVRLDNVLLPEARRLLPKLPAKVLVESATGDPLYWSIDRPSGRVLVLTVNLERGDLPLRTAFPILFSNALSWFDGSGGEIREAVSAGSISQQLLPSSLLQTANGESLKSLSLLAPSGRASEVPVTDGRVTLGPFDECGVWTLQPRGVGFLPANSLTMAATSVLEIACNLSNADESNLSLSPRPDSTAANAPSVLGRPLWFYLVLLAWLLTGLEWVLHQRRVVS